MRLPRLFRTTPFRLTLLFLALFAAAASAFLAYIYLATAGEAQVTRGAADAAGDSAPFFPPQPVTARSNTAEIRAVATSIFLFITFSFFGNDTEL